MRRLHSSALARALPALAEAGLPLKQPTLFERVLGASPTPVLPPLSEALPGVVVPPYVPPTKAPTTVLKKLANGAVVAAEETPGATIAVGIYLESGSKYETAANAGVSHVLERLAFKGTQNRTHFRVTREAEVIGANLLASASREQMAYTIDTVKTHLPEAVELLADSVLNPKFDLLLVKETLAKVKTELTQMESNPQAVLMEAVHTAAFSGGLGNPLVAPSAALKALTPDDFYEFVGANYSAPRLVLAGAGMSADELASYGEPLLSTLPAVPKTPEPKTTYLGGEWRQAGDAGVTSMALAFEVPGGWRDVKTATAVVVLQTLLGGGDSFSAGGPGKGMYSRLYTNVLNKHAWARGCTAFQSVYNDTGLLGVYGTADAARAGDMAAVITAELQAIAKGPVAEAELSRAKAATIPSVLMNLEARAVVAEDIGRQILTYGERKATSSFVADVTALTGAELSAVAAKILKTPLTMVATGDLRSLPRYSEVAKRF